MLIRPADQFEQCVLVVLTQYPTHQRTCMKDDSTQETNTHIHAKKISSVLHNDERKHQMGWKSPCNLRRAVNAKGYPVRYPLHKAHDNRDHTSDGRNNRGQYHAFDCGIHGQAKYYKHMKSKGVRICGIQSRMKHHKHPRLAKTRNDGLNTSIAQNRNDSGRGVLKAAACFQDQP